MKVHAFLALCALALAYGSQIQFTASGKVCNCDPGQANNVCRQSSSEGYLIVHENCNQFYKCVNGQPVTQNCYNGLMYDPLQERCEWPHNVNCGNRPIVEIAPAPAQSEEDDGPVQPCNCDPSLAPTICSGDGSEGALIAHENCNQFYQCNHGRPVTQNCFPGLVYEPCIQRCDWPYNVDCGGRPIVDIEVGGENSNSGENSNEDCGGWSCYCDPAEAPAICAIGDNNGEIVAHENCNQFYQCVHGKPVALTCQNGLHFNLNIGRCDWSENVNCGDRPIVEIPENQSGEGDEDGGSEGGGVGPCNCNPAEAPGICSGAESDGVLVAHENCNQFYKCAHGVPTTQNCPPGLVYHALLHRCDWPYNVDCGDRPIVEVEIPGNPSEEDCEDGGSEGGGLGPCNCNPGEAPGICAVAESDGVLVAHENCNQFYKCAHGVPTTQNCPPGLVYNAPLQRCDWPYNVDCGDRPIVEVEIPGNQSGEGSEGGGSEGGGLGPCNCNPGEAPGICAGVESDGVLVAHENCNQFYKCAHGVPTTQNCPPGLVYNAPLQRCDWPYNVDCGDRPIVEVETPGNQSGEGEGGGSEGGGLGPCNCNPGEAPGICAVAESDGVLVAHENCNQFYKCAHGVPTTQNCPPGLVYNAPLQRCDWPYNVDCGDRPIVEVQIPGNQSGEGSEGGGSEGGGSGPCNCNPGEAPGICAGVESDGVLVAHENCNQFYKCAHGVPTTQNCPPGLVYNAPLQRCDWPYNVDCGDRPIVEVETPGNQSGEGEGGGSEGGGLGPCNCNPGEAPGICAVAESDGVLVAHENCNQFYKCAHGVPTTQNCPPGLVYNAPLQRCDWPYNVDCGDRPIVEVEIPGNPSEEDCEDGGSEGGGSGPCNCNPGEAPGICAGVESDGVLVAHENCNQFYKCAHGVPTTQNCPPGLVYNAPLQRCDWPYNVVCGDRPIVEVETPGSQSGEGSEGGGSEGGGLGPCNCNPGEAPGICAVAESDGVLVAHENCNQFYKCAHGVPTTQSCPPGLVYNAPLQRCDWPYNVDCGNRPIVEIDNSSDQGSNENDSNNDNGGDEECEENNDGTCNCNPGDAAAICQNTGSDGELVAHENCNQFYKCAHGVPVTQNCYPGLVYHPSLQRCEWPHNVDCGDRPIVEIEDNNQSNESGGDNGDNGNTCNCNPAEAPAICAADNSESVLVAHEKCNYFYKCSFGKPVAMRCQGGLLYNPYSRACDWPQNVQCGDRIISDSSEEQNTEESEERVIDGHCDPSQAPAICAAPGSEDVLVAHENCNQFYVCNGGKPVALVCAGNTLYNPSIERCDWREHVDCGDRIVIETETPGGECACDSRMARFLCANHDSNGKFIAHDKCDQFYLCVGGIPVEFWCPAGLFYEPHTQACDWPSNVNCDGRGITTLYSFSKHLGARRGIF